ncbi:YafY family protein [Streptomyces sp. NPDC005438]|uniref:helix-turn-helix transcriptional regulator n=1 Tax=Streptomyces sp. NPDC005438 TaxID=3156880 RepID=UPI0033B9DB86
MLETSARLLRLLSLLQAHREWSGPELAERLDVTARTVRRDVDRLRLLGYPVHSTSGTTGGYRLGAGARLPPLLLDDEEAVAVAVGLQSAAFRGVRGIEESSARALAKLEQVLPDRLRRRVGALSEFTVPMARRRDGGIESETLSELAYACRDHRELRFAYRGHDGAESRRRVQPHRLVSTAYRWYLVGWDTDRADWRTFRVDRVTLTPPHGPTFTPREPPADNLAEYVAHGVSVAAYDRSATVLLHTSVERAAEWISMAGGVLEPVDEHRCLLRAGAPDLNSLTVYLLMLGVDFEVREPAELRAHLSQVRERLNRALDAPEAGNA